MYIRNTVILAIALLLPLSMSAQKRKKRVVKKPVVEVPQEDPRITSMREMTQQITIIDSIVADKDQLLSQLLLSNETGRILSSSAFWGKGDSTTRQDASSAVVRFGGKATVPLSLSTRWATRPISVSPMTV